MLEHELAVGRQRQPPGAAMQQSRAHLGLERRHLLGDRRLGERERRRGAGERTLVSDRPEREESARVHRQILCHYQNHDLNLWDWCSTLPGMHTLILITVQQTIRRSLIGARGDDPVVRGGRAL
jgi:hypothetical protein